MQNSNKFSCKRASFSQGALKIPQMSYPTFLLRWIERQLIKLQIMEKLPASQYKEYQQVHSSFLKFVCPRMLHLIAVMAASQLHFRTNENAELADSSQYKLHKLGGSLQPHPIATQFGRFYEKKLRRLNNLSYLRG